MLCNAVLCGTHVPIKLNIISNNIYKQCQWERCPSEDSQINLGASYSDGLLVQRPVERKKFDDIVVLFDCPVDGLRLLRRDILLDPQQNSFIGVAKIIVVPAKYSWDIHLRMNTAVSLLRFK